MAHFAEIDQNNIVIRVIVVDNEHLINPATGLEDEGFGRVWCLNTIGLSENGADWIQTSYNRSFRKKYAGTGDTYDRERDAFIYPCTLASWVLNEEDCEWYPPIPRPEDPEDGSYIWIWNEEIVNWEKLFRDPQ